MSPPTLPELATRGASRRSCSQARTSSATKTTITPKPLPDSISANLTNRKRVSPASPPAAQNLGPTSPAAHTTVPRLRDGAHRPRRNERVAIRRRAAGATLRELAAEYRVAHTTLGRYFARPPVATQLRAQANLVRAERRAAQAERAAERKLKRQVRRQAHEQARLERAPTGRVAAVQLARRRPVVRGAYAAWLDEHDRARPLTRAELHSGSDDIAAAVVASGAGIEAIVEATDLRTRENVLRLIDPAILVHAFANDDEAAAVAEPNRDRLRRLVPDPALIQRRAAGETLRPLAVDYHVAHTTLARYFRRPAVTGQLRTARRLTRTNHTRPTVPTNQPAG
jgi:hypothetical protein